MLCFRNWWYRLCGCTKKKKKIKKIREKKEKGYELPTGSKNQLPKNFRQKEEEEEEEELKHVVLATFKIFF